MDELVYDAFVQAIQSESVKLKVGPNNEEIVISKALLAYKSGTFAKLLSKPALTELTVPNIGVAVCKMFVCWCYQERLQPLDNPTPQRRKGWKELLIDVWLFGDEYGIPKLKNQVMKQLTGPTVFGSPALLQEADITYVWSRLNVDSREPLKDLFVITLVAQLEMGKSGKDIRDYQDLATLPDFMPKLYKAPHLWLKFEVPAKQKNKKWVLLLQSEDVKEALEVEEKERANVAAPTFGAKRPEPKPFQPGEVVVID